LGDFLVEVMASLSVVVKDSNGVAPSGHLPAFRSLNPSILEISSSGLLPLRFLSRDSLLMQ